MGTQSPRRALFTEHCVCKGPRAGWEWSPQPPPTPHLARKPAGNVREAKCERDIPEATRLPGGGGPSAGDTCLPARTTQHWPSVPPHLGPSVTQEGFLVYLPHVPMFLFKKFFFFFSICQRARATSRGGGGTCCPKSRTDAGLGPRTLTS